MFSNVSYTGYRNHIQKDTLQEYGKYDQCDQHWTCWFIDWVEQQSSSQSPAYDLIGQDNHWEVSESRV